MSSNTLDLEMFLSERATVATHETFSAGTMFGVWRVTAFIGKGGSSEVYRVKNDSDGRVAALKIYIANPSETDSRQLQMRQQFLKESKLLSANTLSLFPQFFEAGVKNGVPYFILELLEPVVLPKDDKAVGAFLLAVCQDVRALHQKGFVHRDIKPQNIMRRANGEYVLIDFGLAKQCVGENEFSGSSVTMVDGHIIGSGTPRYAAPEQFMGGKISPASDIHALGMLTNECFQGSPKGAWKRIVNRSTSSIPNQRYRDVDAFMRAVRHRHVRRKCFLFVSVFLVVGCGLWGVWKSPLLDMYRNSVEYRLHLKKERRFLAGLSRPVVRLWDGGPFWATVNIGAAKPEEEGYLFWWGDTVGYTRDGDKWVASNGTVQPEDPFRSKKLIFTYPLSVATMLRDGIVRPTTSNPKDCKSLVPAYDAATAHWGPDWRMPTPWEIDELIRFCTLSWTTNNGVCGVTISGIKDHASKSIFIPASDQEGTLWTSTADTGEYMSWIFLFSPEKSEVSLADRNLGKSIRPVAVFRP